MNKLGVFICLAILVNACHSSAPETATRAEKKQFSYFEISYSNGWGHNFSFSVDSNKIFFFPHYQLPHTDFKFNYGQLPDSIFNTISNIIPLLSTMKNQDKNKYYCDDCGILSVMAVNGKDTLRLYQQGEVDKRMDSLVVKLQTLHANKKATKSIHFFNWQTEADIFSPPKLIEK